MKAIAATLANQIGKNHLVNCISRVLIIAYQESTRQLEEVLTQQKLQYEVLRQENKPEFQHCSRSYLCLLNHQRAWAKATQEKKPTIIIEADFVPVVNFGQLPLPFNPNQSDVGVSWLYTCAPQVYHVSVDGYAEGFSTSTVAYIVTPKSANYLIELAEQVKEQVGAANYSTWDSTVDSFLRRRKLKNYIGWRNYGEHGGLPNPEHFQNKLSRTHRADVLYAKLAFTPLYASHEKSKMKLLTVRLKARLKGIARLATGRFLRVKVIRGSSVPTRLIGFAVLRHFSLQL
ncbi:LPS biosynthesis glycosyltransferase [Nostocaceae cyanobacterium CENA369]|uniref:LPS biosynthesis glycosyltransferase n=1 Tax=Dendronalium phyllosphericum CENA369 TaxID=1725256 RepID=A0A8J7LEU2_9NOST|nr:LPS biosynthesis glycosyltransferase [Dendronalium phyllosphericum]MBH8573139.1 LPS biosynthesis glycosyltransferase [Dendronalium phyllosphericum CENA369]